LKKYKAVQTFWGNFVLESDGVGGWNRFGEGETIEIANKIADALNEHEGE
jgi:hypothetical protein